MGGLTDHECVAAWGARHLRPGTVFTSDSLNCFAGLQDACREHWYALTGGGQASVKTPELHSLNTLLGNLKRSLRGTWHFTSAKHPPRYFAEFSYRFNRRFNPRQMLPQPA